MRQLDEAIEKKAPVNVISTILDDIKYVEVLGEKYTPPGSGIYSTTCKQCGKELLARSKRQTLHDHCYRNRQKPN